MLRVFYFFLGLVAAVSGYCSSPYEQVGQGCYVFSFKSSLKKDWTEARKYCQEQGSYTEPADLAVLDTLCDDYRHISNYLLVEGAHISIDTIYIGATGADDSWFWVNGTPLSPSAVYWHWNYPIESPSCVYLQSATSTESYERMYAFSGNCTTERYFICQNNIHARR